MRRWVFLLCGCVALGSIHCEVRGGRELALERPRRFEAPPQEPAHRDDPVPEPRRPREAKAPEVPHDASPSREGEPVPEPQSREQVPQPKVALGLTYHRPDGNRLVSGVGQLSKAQALSASIPGVASWVVGVAFGQGAVWAVALSDGAILGFQSSQGKLAPYSLKPNRLPAGTPPVLVADGGGVRLLQPPTAQASALTHPVLLPASGRVAFLEKSGDLVLWAGDKEVGRAAIKALPDARILVDEKQRLLVLTGPTTRYAHGVLGDGVEASSIALLVTTPRLQLLRKIDIPGQKVVEGIAPIWADLDGDGVREIIVTLSDASQGAQLVAYREDGKVLARSPAIGAGNRWRNQMAVAAFGPDKALELVDVYTPHIGGPTEFFRLVSGGLTRVAQVQGYTSHVYGSRNLDLGLAGDLDGDGAVELLLPSQDLSHLGALRHESKGGVVAWKLPLSGRLSSNLAAVTLPDQKILLAAATQGLFRVWGP